MADPTKAELQQLLTDTTKRATTAERRVEQLTKDLEALGDQAERSGKLAAEHAKEIDRLNEELRSTTASLKAYKGSATKARDQVTILKREISPETRAIGAMKPPRNDDEAAARTDALAAAFALDTTELVFSDGKREIRELAPLIISGEAWRDTPNGRVLNHEPLLEPGACQRQSLELRGFGLLNEAGEQVGYCALPDAVTIASGTRVQIPLNSIRF
jgi:hypothetical protein